MTSNDPSSDSTSDDDEKRANELAPLFDRHWEARQRGEPLDTESWINLHPDGSAGLADFKVLEALHDAADAVNQDLQLGPEECEDDIALTYSIRRADGCISAAVDRIGNQTLNQAFQPGVVLGERYALERELGRGGMGVVYLGRDLRLGRQVAVKGILPRQRSLFASDTKRRNMFEEEARLGASLLHPAIATVFDFGFHEGNPYSILEYVPGETLRDVLRRRQCVPLDEVQSIVMALAQALDYAHSHHIVHRDLKPENIRVTQGGAYKILDLGLARRFNLENEWSFAGTPAYASPEQCAEQHSDGRTDQYALALIAYEMLTGTRPFVAKDRLALLQMHISQRPVSAGQLRRDIPGAVSNAVDRALSKPPENRFASCHDFALAIGCQTVSGTSTAQENPEVVVFQRSDNFSRFHNLVRRAAMDGKSIWSCYGETIDRWPFGSIKEAVSKKNRLELRVSDSNRKARRIVWVFPDSAICQKWHSEIEDRRNSPPHEGDNPTQVASRQTILLIKQRPPFRFQQCGAVEATTRSSQLSLASVCLRAAMSGAEAIIGLESEKRAMFRDKWRLSGIAVRSVNADGRRQLISRWYWSEITKVSNLTFWFGILVFFIGMYQTSLRWISFRDSDLEVRALTESAVVMARYYYFWQLATAVLLRWLRWRQLVIPTAFTLAVSAASCFAWIGGGIHCSIVYQSTWEASLQALRGIFAPVLSVVPPIIGLVLARHLWLATRRFRNVLPKAERRAAVSRLSVAALIWFISLLFAFLIIRPEYAIAYIRTRDVHYRTLSSSLSSSFYSRARPFNNAQDLQDWANDTSLFWTDQLKQTIYCMNLNSGEVRYFPGLRLKNPRGIFIDRATRQMFFADYGHDYIAKTDLNTSDASPIIKNVPGVRGITVDLQARKIYWTDRDLKRVFRADLDGSHEPETLLTEDNGLQYPYSIQLDVSRGEMYIEDHHARSIFRANLDGSEPEAFADLKRCRGNIPAGMVIDVPNRMLYYTEAAGDSQCIRRIGLDMGATKLVVGGLQYPTGLVIDAESEKLYWAATEGRFTVIQRSNLDGSDVERVAVAGSVRAMALCNPKRSK
jgi:serine/threonine protein kinase